MKKGIFTVYIAVFSLLSCNSYAQKNPFIKHMYTADPSARVWNDGRLYVLCIA